MANQNVSADGQIGNIQLSDGNGLLKSSNKLHYSTNTLYRGANVFCRPAVYSLPCLSPHVSFESLAPHVSNLVSKYLK